MAAPAAYKSYQQTRIMTASQRELILMLYSGSIRFLRQGLKALESDDREGAHKAIIRGRRIVAELMSSLNHQAGEIAANLFELYGYVFRLLIDANARQSVEPLREAVEILSTLKEGWEGIPVDLELM